MSSDGFYSFPTDQLKGAFTSDLGEFKQALSCDFYSQLDDVTRGVTLPLGDQTALPTDPFQDLFTNGLGEFKPSLSCDYYVERDDVTRGVSMPLGDAFGLSQPFDINHMSKFMHPDTSSISCKCFVAENDAPTLSEDIEAFLQITNLQLSDTPVGVGNRLLSFFENEAEARIKKLNQTKFTMKVDVFWKGIWCCLKVRIYQTGDGTLVEFQKRSGDSVAFCGLYRQVEAYLLGTSSPQTASLSPPTIPHVEALPAEQTVDTLLDMANACQDMNLLAQVVSALNAMVEDPAVVTALRMPCAFSALQELEQVDDFRVSYPTSHMLDICQLSAHQCIWGM